MRRPARLITLAAAATASLLALSGCGSSADPLADPSAAVSAGDTLVIGSQDYYSNEIIAEIYAQALEAADYTVDRQFRIGQREVYVAEIEDGSIDLFPEYTGPLLTYWDPETTARLEDEVYPALAAVTPDGLRVLDASSATDQDTYVVTRAFSEEYGITSVADLASAPAPVTLGGPAEGEIRPIGPSGLQETYGVDVEYTVIEDGGGPVTVQALQDGVIDLAVLYTASPIVAGDDLVQLADPAGLLLSSHVVPVASDKVDADAASIIDAISAALTPEGLLDLNSRSVDEQVPAATIARDWLAQTSIE
ncbi:MULTISPECIES: ABC transporter substrate-binding protein [unclassified Rathayibacter]|uniref:ABC transporter substrate-binding protein n=1 Tax=unclassified Rathayibacter TaxID=2609250 RepID=UPI001047B954|nr:MULTISPECIES: ABC transporter substrate-binding protein [unclassified Rathayibacter]TCL79437.1 osmoprotectant transport system substrate-binding protein [Rathayibacter sp. PhB192]TCM25294.1 osmoprotectant transport system substrate-binding protein [Rathayibacter sp. PhB179]